VSNLFPVMHSPSAPSTQSRPSCSAENDSALIDFGSTSDSCVPGLSVS
jgi:hypothetical protein